MERKGDRALRHSTHPRPINPDLRKKKKYRNKAIDEISLIKTGGNQKQSMKTFNYLCKGNDLVVCICNEFSRISQF